MRSHRHKNTKQHKSQHQTTHNTHIRHAELLQPQVVSKHSQANTKHTTHTSDMLICCSHSWSASTVKPTLNTTHISDMLICCSHSWSASTVKSTPNTQHTHKTCWSVAATAAHQVRLPSGDSYRAHSWRILPHTAPHSIWSPQHHTTQTSCHFAAWRSRQLGRLGDPWPGQGPRYVLHWIILQWPSLPETGDRMSHVNLLLY